MNQQYRRSNGKKLEGNALANRIAQDVPGMMLAMAFIKAKSAGLRLHVHRLDGNLVPAHKDRDVSRLNVEVTEGYVRKAWIG